MRNPSSRQTPKSTLVLSGIIALLVGGLIAATGDFRPPGKKTTYEWSNFIQPEDCNASTCDLAPAWDRMMSECQPEIGAPPGQGARVGCSITLAPGEFRLSKQLEWCRGHQLRGAGGGHWSAATIIHVARGMSGIRTMFAYECNAFGRGFGADAARIADLALVSDGAHTDGLTPTYGVHIENALNTLENVWIRGFTINVFVSADHTRSPYGTNANGWRVINSTLDVADHAGIYVTGGDSNVGLGLGLNSSSNCAHGSKWEARFGRCANMVLHDFLGSSIVAGHTAAPYEFYKPALVGSGSLALSVYGYASLTVPTGSLHVGDFIKMMPGGRAIVTAVSSTSSTSALATARIFDKPIAGAFTYTVPYRTFPAYDFNKPSQRGLCLNCYAENDQLPSIIGQNGNVIGGLATWEGMGGVLQGPAMNSLVIRNAQDDANPVDLAFGRATSPGTFFEARPVDPTTRQGTYSFRFKYEPSTGTFREDVANLNSGVVRRIGAKTSAPGGYGQQWLPRPPLVGPTPATAVPMLVP